MDIRGQSGPIGAEIFLLGDKAVLLPSVDLFDKLLKEVNSRFDLKIIIILRHTAGWRIKNGTSFHNLSSIDAFVNLIYCIIAT